MKRFVGFFSAILAVGSLALNAPDSPAHASRTSDHCGKVDVVFARGSGQELGARESSAFKTLFLQRAQQELKLSSDDIIFHELDKSEYPAVAVGASALKNTLGAWVSAGKSGNYGASVDRGIDSLNTYLEKRLSQCRNSATKPNFILAGYSQGAQLVGQAFTEKFSDDVRRHVVFNALFGDPKLYLPEGEGFFIGKTSWAPACSGKELSVYRRSVPDCNTDTGSLGARKPYLPPSWEKTTGLWCNDRDYVCGSAVGLWETDGHMTYGETAVPAAVNESVTRLGEKLGNTRAPSALTSSPKSGAYIRPVAFESRATRTISSDDIDDLVKRAQKAQQDALLERASQPMIVLSISEYFVPVGEPVRFDASASISPDSHLVEWAWDFDADGTWDLTADKNIVEHVYETAGDYTAKIKVTDARRRVVEREVQVHVGTITGTEGAPRPATHVTLTKKGDAVQVQWEASESPTGGWIVAVNGVALGKTLPDARNIMISDLPHTSELEVGIQPVTNESITGTTQVAYLGDKTAYLQEKGALLANRNP